MRRAINGLIYDTETAQHLAHRSRGFASDWSHVREGLYVTERGTYFLAGEGGPRSRYGRRTGDGGTRGGEGIHPLSREEALEWCERHAQEVALDHFADDLEPA